LIGLRNSDVRRIKLKFKREHGETERVQPALSVP
jgi:hypothetical protein